LNDKVEIQPEHKLARMTTVTVQGEDEEVEVTLEQQIEKFVVDNNGEIVGQERTFTNVQHCLVQEEDLLGYLNVDRMTKCELVHSDFIPLCHHLISILPLQQIRKRKDFSSMKKWKERK